MLTLFDKLDK